MFHCAISLQNAGLADLHSPDVLLRDTGFVRCVGKPLGRLPVRLI